MPRSFETLPKPYSCVGRDQVASIYRLFWGSALSASIRASPLACCYPVNLVERDEFDINTLFLVTIYVEVILGLLLLFAWVQNTAITAVAWWGFAHLLRATSVGSCSACTDRHPI